MQVTMHPADESLDADAACVAVRRSISECCRADHHDDPKVLAAWLRNKTTDRFRSWFQAQDRFAAVARSEEEIVGVGLISVAGEVQLLYVVPEALYQGTGKALLRALERWFLAQGGAAIHLESTETGRPFYLRNGYELTGSVAEHFGVKSYAMRKECIDA